MEKKKSLTLDMTQGNTIKIILLFAIPIFLGNIFQHCYNMVDTIIVGHHLGDDAIASIGATSAISSLVVGFANGMGGGFSMIVSRYFGAREKALMKNAVAATMVLCILVSLFLTTVSLIFIKPFLEVLDTPADIIDMSYSYISIILAGIIVTMLYNTGAGLLRAIGNSKTPLLILILTCLLNIGLDIVLVIYFNMGVRGAAIATLVSQAISAVAVFVYIYRKCPELQVSKQDFKVAGWIYGDLLSTGISMGLMFSIVAIGTVALQKAINGLGKSYITAHTAARKISEVYMLTIGTFCNAAATFTSQNFGAKNYRRVKDGIIKSILLSWIWSTVCIIVTFLAAPILIELITGTSQQDVIDIASKYLKINLPFYYVLSILLVLRSCMQSIGMRIFPLCASGIELAGKFIVAYMLVPKMHYMGVCISEPVTWILCSALLIIALFISPKGRIFTLADKEGYIEY